MFRRFPRLVVFALTLLSYPIYADDLEEDSVYLDPAEFLAETFSGDPPTPSLLWITPELKPAIRKILKHDYAALRLRYWRKDSTTAWILEEIGKVKPITVGIEVTDSKIARLKVLIYRESHGWEVKYPFFTDQFKEADIDNRLRLDKSIDGISGATLSVNALEKLARLALYLDQVVMASLSEETE